MVGMTLPAIPTVQSKKSLAFPCLRGKDTEQRLANAGNCQEENSSLLGWEQAGVPINRVIRLSREGKENLFNFNYCYRFIISRFCFIFIDASLSKFLPCKPHRKLNFIVIHSCLACMIIVHLNIIHNITTST